MNDMNVTVTETYRTMASKIVALFAREKEGPTALCWSHGRHGSRWNSGSGRVEVRSDACQISESPLKSLGEKKTVFFWFLECSLYGRPEYLNGESIRAASAKTWIVLDRSWQSCRYLHPVPKSAPNISKEPGGINPGGVSPSKRWWSAFWRSDMSEQVFWRHAGYLYHHIHHCHWFVYWWWLNIIDVYWHWYWMMSVYYVI